MTTVRLVNAMTGQRSDPVEADDAYKAVFSPAPLGRWDGYVEGDGPYRQWTDATPVIVVQDDIDITVHTRGANWAALTARQLQHENRVLRRALTEAAIPLEVLHGLGGWRHPLLARRWRRMVSPELVAQIDKAVRELRAAVRELK